MRERVKFYMSVIYSNTSLFKVGDLVIIRNYISGGDEWVLEHKVEHWYTGTSDLQGLMYCRRITAIDEASKTIIVDIPIRYALKTRDESSVHKLDGMIEEVGICDLSIGNIRHPGNTGWEPNDHEINGKLNC